MTSVRDYVMNALYGHDVWKGFRPFETGGVQGWNGEHPSLARLASGGDGTKVVADVGVWKGQSTINMALAMRQQSIDGVVIAIDTFLGSPEHWSPGNELFARVHGWPDLYATFLSNAANAGVKDYIVPLPQTSVSAANILRRSGIQLDIAHIDAAHEYEEVLRDAEEYWALLRPGGFLIGDDYHETWGGVVKAAAAFSLKTGRPLIIETPKWIMHKP